MRGGARPCYSREIRLSRFLPQYLRAPIETWRDYLTASYLHAYAAYLPTEFDEQDFSFFGAVLGGNRQQLPRRTRAAHLLDDSMGEALGKTYAAQYFPPDAKAQALIS